MGSGDVQLASNVQKPETNLISSLKQTLLSQPRTEEGRMQSYSLLVSLHAALNLPSAQFSQEESREARVLISAALDYLKLNGFDIKNFEADVKSELKNNGVDAISVALEPSADSAFQQQKLHYANILFVAWKFSDTKNMLLWEEAEQVASFKEKMDQQGTISSSNLYRILSAMAEAFDARREPDAFSNIAPDMHTFRFGGSEAGAKYFKSLIDGLPLFQATYSNMENDPASGGWIVSFKLQFDTGKEFKAPAASAAAKAKSITLPDQPYSNYRMTATWNWRLIKNQDVVSDLAVAQQTDEDKCISEQPFVFNLKISGMAKYGIHYKPDNTVTKEQAKDLANADLFEMARTMGFDPKLPIETWVLTEAGQEFISKLNTLAQALQKEGKKITIIGTADCVVFYNKDDPATWSAAAESNGGLANERLDKVFDYFGELNASIVAQGKKEGKQLQTLDLSQFERKAKVCFFQDGLPKEATEKYGHVEGEGEQRMQSFMEFMKKASEGGLDGVLNGVTPKEIADAKKYYSLLISSGAIKHDKTSDKYTIGSISLLNQYLRRMDGDSTLIDASGDAYSGAKDGMMNEGAYNIVVRGICESSEGSNRGLLVSGEFKANINHEIGDYNTEAGTATVLVKYTVGDIPMYFNTNTNGRINFKFVENNAEKTETPLAAAMEEVDGRPSGTFMLSEIPAGKAGKIVSEAVVTQADQDVVNSGMVWQKAAPEAPEKKYVPETIPDIKPPQSRLYEPTLPQPLLQRRTVVDQSITRVDVTQLFSTSNQETYGRGLAALQNTTDGTKIWNYYTQSLLPENGADHYSLQNWVEALGSEKNVELWFKYYSEGDWEKLAAMKIKEGTGLYDAIKKKTENISKEFANTLETRRMTIGADVAMRLRQAARSSHWLSIGVYNEKDSYFVHSNVLGTNPLLETSRTRFTGSLVQQVMLSPQLSLVLSEGGELSHEKGKTLGRGATAHANLVAQRVVQSANGAVAKGVGGNIGAGFQYFKGPYGEESYIGVLQAAGNYYPEKGILSKISLKGTGTLNTITGLPAVSSKPILGVTPAAELEFSLLKKNLFTVSVESGINFMQGYNPQYYATLRIPIFIKGGKGGAATISPFIDYKYRPAKEAAPAQ